MKTHGVSVVTLLAVSSLGSAATLSLRWEGSSESTVQQLVCEEAVIEMVLELGEGESLGFGIIFPTATVTDGDGNVIEVIDFAPEPGQLEGATFDRSAIPPGNPYPYGEGIGFGPAQYGLNLGNTNLDGPATVVLDNIVVHAISLGEAQVTFSEGLLIPQLFNLAVGQYTVLPAGSGEITGSLSLGLGDNRSGGAGPLVFEVVNEIPAPMLNENQNTSTNSNNNSSNGNSNTGGGPGGGGGGGGLCGLGMLAPLSMCAMLILGQLLANRRLTSRS